MTDAAEFRDAHGNVIETDDLMEWSSPVRPVPRANRMMSARQRVLPGYVAPTTHDVAAYLQRWTIDIADAVGVDPEPWQLQVPAEVDERGITTALELPERPGQRATRQVGYERLPGRHHQTLPSGCHPSTRRAHLGLARR